MFQIRKANIKDIDKIILLVDKYVKDEILIPVKKEQLIESIRDFFVAQNNQGEIIGVVALHIYTINLAEIRTLVVKKKYQNKYIGKGLVDKCIFEAKQLGIKKVFALTKAEGFFKSLKFSKIDKEDLPEKVYKDCIYCPKLHHCDEIPVIKYI